uniref:Uncharacterized protein n=1 Tax=Amphimedon queenslandica TaxID=400682 RepID=A0A1X7U0E1_AMPQE
MQKLDILKQGNRFCKLYKTLSIQKELKQRFQVGGGIVFVDDTHQLFPAHSEKEEILCINDNKDGRGLPVTRGCCRGRHPAKVHSEKELSFISDNEDGCGLPVTRGLGCRQLKAVRKNYCVSVTIKIDEVTSYLRPWSKKSKSEDGKVTGNQGESTDKAEGTTQMIGYVWKYIKKEVKVMDSLGELLDLNDHTLIQIARFRLVKSKKTSIIIQQVSTQQQLGVRDCGLIEIANSLEVYL